MVRIIKCFYKEIFLSYYYIGSKRKGLKSYQKSGFEQKFFNLRVWFYYAYLGDAVFGLKKRVFLEEIIFFIFIVPYTALYLIFLPLRIA